MIRTIVLFAFATCFILLGYFSMLLVMKHKIARKPTEIGKSRDNYAFIDDVKRTGIDVKPGVEYDIVYCINYYLKPEPLYISMIRDTVNVEVYSN